MFVSSFIVLSRFGRAGTARTRTAGSPSAMAPLHDAYFHLEHRPPGRRISSARQGWVVAHSWSQQQAGIVSVQGGQHRKGRALRLEAVGEGAVQALHRVGELHRAEPQHLAQRCSGVSRTAPTAPKSRALAFLLSGRMVADGPSVVRPFAGTPSAHLHCALC